MTRPRFLAAMTLAFTLTLPVRGASFQGLGDLPGGSYRSSANGVSADGTVVVGVGHSVNGNEAFHWTISSGMVGLGSLPGGERFSSVASAVSSDGSVVIGTSGSPAGARAFRWTRDSGMIGLIDASGQFSQSHGLGVSFDGTAIVGYGFSPSNPEALRWTEAEGMVGLGSLGMAGVAPSYAFDISAHGSVVVGESASPNGVLEAFRWTVEEGIVGLGDLPGNEFQSRARGVSADGSVVVGDSNSVNGTEVFRWTDEDGMVGFGDGVANDVSGDGNWIVGHRLLRATIWDISGHERDLHDVYAGHGLNLTGWHLLEATSVSGDGRTIVGFGTNPSGAQEGWIAVIPEPSSCYLAAIAGCGMPFICRRVMKRHAR